MTRPKLGQWQRLLLATLAQQSPQWFMVLAEQTTGAETNIQRRICRRALTRLVARGYVHGSSTIGYQLTCAGVERIETDHWFCRPGRGRDGVERSQNHHGYENVLPALS
jgi:hypothetical protein